jgi:predicted metal-dependent phosphoesterase TrpH
VNVPFADFHLHSHYSDGSDAPAEVVARAAALGMAALALTDHDTTGGVGEARVACEYHGILFLPGTEVSTLFRHGEVHVLGLGIDPSNPDLREGLARQKADRASRAAEIAAKLRRRGIIIDGDALAARAPGGLVGRMHIAALLHEQGHASTVQDGFNRYLNRNRPAWVPKRMVAPEEAIGWIHAAGGLAFLAHPGIGKSTGQQLQALLQLPFDGIEAYHVHHSPGVTAQFLELAASRGLLVTGGSDCHGTVKGHAPEMGKVRLPMHHAEVILNRFRGIKA